MKTYRIAAIPGDGIGTEVIGVGVEALTPDLCGAATTEEVIGATVAAIRDGGQNPGISDRSG